MVPSDEEAVVALVVNEKREHSSQLVQEVFALLQVQRDDRLAVRACQRLPEGWGVGRRGGVTLRVTLCMSVSYLCPRKRHPQPTRKYGSKVFV